VTRTKALVLGVVGTGAIVFFFLRPEPAEKPRRAEPLVEATRDERQDGSATPLSTTEQNRKAQQRLEARFLHAAADPEWAARAKTIVDQNLPSLLPEGSKIRSFECRASMCRLETAHKNHGQYMKFIQAAFLSPEDQLWNAPTFSTPLNGNPADGLMVTYIAREGGSLSD
jgi:hypothetical protein